MLKKKYIINVNNQNLDDFDPNIDYIVKDIRYMLACCPGRFEFEVSVLLNGFIYNSFIDELLNTMLHDVADPDSLFACLFRRDDFADYVKQYIKAMMTTGNDDREDAYTMEAFYDAGNGYIVAQVYLPKTRMSEEKYKEYIYQGADYLIGSLTVGEIFTYVLAPVYQKLAQCGLLDNAAYKDFSKYKIGAA